VTPVTNPTQPPAPSPPSLPDPAQLLRSKSYVVLLVIGGIVGVPAAGIALFFLKAVDEVQNYVFTSLPTALGFHGTPTWWPLPLLTLSGVLVAATIHYLPGTAGHEPSEGFKTSGAVMPIELPGIVLAAFATLSLGAVLGPEAPLIAIGSGIGVIVMRLIRRDAPEMAVTVIAAAGSFAAVSALLGSPILGAFLMMEAAGLGGAMMSVVLVPGLLASGVGALIFVGLGHWTGFGTFSLAVPDIPPFGSPTVGEFLWAIGIGLLAAVLGTGILRLAKLLRPVVSGRRMALTPVVGLAVGAFAVIFAEVSGKGSSFVLFSGETALPQLIDHAATFSLGALLLLLVCKSLAYGASLSSFRGGPTFPGMFIGAVGGIALSHLPGLPMIAGAAMGIGAMTVVMLGGLPLTSVLLTTAFLSADGLPLMPLVIVAVVVAFVVSTRLRPAPPSPAPQGPEAPPGSGAVADLPLAT
jgi:H+/Cl- antiporter ClcA